MPQEGAGLAPASESYSWWPWLLLAAAAGVALALLVGRRQKRAPAPVLLGPSDRAGEGSGEWQERGTAAGAARQAQPAPPAAPPPVAPDPPLPTGLVTTRLGRPRPSPPPTEAPPLPAGLVNTRLRSAPPVPAEPVPTGAVVSTGLRPWLDLELALDELSLTVSEAVLRFRLSLLNSGTASARSIVIEALALNAGDDQASELSSFFARPDGVEVAMAELARLQSVEVAHEIRMPRSAIREYEVQGRRLFVPILAFNAGYRWAGGQGRTSAAFLVGHEQPGSDRLAPVGMKPGGFRAAGLGVRRLEQQIRR